MLPRRGEQYEAADVERAISGGWPESATLEYKADPSIGPGDRRRIEQKLEAIVARAVCAFANSGGGSLVLGVADRGGQPVAANPPGLPRAIGRDRVDERIDFIVSRCVEPRPPCTVHFAPIDDQRAFVIVEVAARGGGPYRVTQTTDATLNERYYVRRGRQSIQVDHFTLQELFADAQAGRERVREYLARRGFGDVLLESFGRREPARLLSEDGVKTATGAVFVTLVPEVLRGDVLDFDRPEVRAQFVPGRMGLHDERATLEGRMRFRASPRPPLLRAYLHAHRNGYIEAGDTRAFHYPNDGKFFDPQIIVEIVRSTLNQAAALYDIAGVRDRVLVGLHLRSAGDSVLGIPSVVPIRRGYNTQEHLSIEELVVVDELVLDTTVARIDRRLGNAYGMDVGMVLNEDGSPRTFLPPPT